MDRLYEPAQHEPHRAEKGRIMVTELHIQRIGFVVFLLSLASAPLIGALAH
ncbi:hypothetical protein [Methylobacterium sp. A54F]